MISKYGIIYAHTKVSWIHRISAYFHIVTEQFGTLNASRLPPRELSDCRFYADETMDTSNKKFKLIHNRISLVLLKFIILISSYQIVKTI